MLRIVSFVWPLLFGAALVTACGANSDSVADVKVAVELNTLSCDQAPTNRVSLKSRVLESNGIEVKAISCGSWDVGSTTVCGVSDFALAFFLIKETDIPRAKELGFFDPSFKSFDPNVISAKAVDNGPCPAWR